MEKIDIEDRDWPKEKKLSKMSSVEMNEWSFLYKILEPMFIEEENIPGLPIKETVVTNPIVPPIELRDNEKLVHDMKEFDHGKTARELYKEIDWSSKKAENKAWRDVRDLVEKYGVARFYEKKSRPYVKTISVKNSQRRRKFSKMSQEEIDKKYKSNYKIGERNGKKNN